MKRATSLFLLVLMAATVPWTMVAGQDDTDLDNTDLDNTDLEDTDSAGTLEPGTVIIRSSKAPDRDLLKDTIQENTNELDRLRSQIHQNRNRIKKLDQKESAVLRGHEEIQADIELSRQLLNDMVQQEIVLMERSQLLQSELDIRLDTFQARKESLAGNLRSMYLRSQSSDLEMIMTSESFSELLTSVKASRTLARLGAGMLREVRTEGQILRREQRSLNAALAEIWQTREEQNQENDRLEELLAEQMGALRELETERKDIKRQLLQLGQNEQKLNYILTDLEQQRTERSAKEQTRGNPLVASAGDLEWPVRGQLLRGFGRSVHPKFKTVTLNNGFNIAAAEGAPVAAVAEGTVEYSDHLPGFGQCVILDHGAGYYTLYAHLEGAFVAKGDEIARGQVIAEVGRPTAGEEPQLYFEVRQGRTPLDPADWLKSR